MKLMTRIEELLAGRERLARYDELTDWKKKFEDNSEEAKITLGQNYIKWNDYNLFIGSEKEPLPDDIREIIVNALDAEIKKLDEE